MTGMPTYLTNDSNSGNEGQFRMNTIDKQLALCCLENLASREEQERLWLARTGNETGSLAEAWCGFFDDAGIARAMESGYLQKTYSEELCRKVEALRNLLKQLPEPAPPKLVIAHPKMEEVRRIAADLLILFSQENGTINESE